MVRFPEEDYLRKKVVSNFYLENYDELENFLVYPTKLEKLVLNHRELLKLKKHNMDVLDFQSLEIVLQKLVYQ